MTSSQYRIALALNYAGVLARMGCRILAANAHTSQPWIKAAMPVHITPRQRVQIMAKAWTSPVLIEWRS
jgi:hypothetical protein